MDNIKESKEYQLAKDWERAVNDYGFNPKRFAAAIPEIKHVLKLPLCLLTREKILLLFFRPPMSCRYRFPFLSGWRLPQTDTVLTTGSINYTQKPLHTTNSHKSLMGHLRDQAASG